ncbi:MAG: hypothetical protein AAGD11_08680 [Planctomycetota bacterium]
MLSYCRTSRDAIGSTAARLTMGSLTISLIGAAGFLMGCSEPNNLGPDLYTGYESDSWESAQSQLTTAATESPSQLQLLPPRPESAQSTPSSTSTDELESPYWSFPTEADQYFADSFPVLIPLPPVEEPAEAGIDTNAASTTLPAPIDQDTEDMVVAQLLPPRALSEISTGDESGEPAFAMPLTQVEIPESTDITPTPSSPLPMIAELDEQQQTMNRMLADSSSATTGVLTDHRLDELAKAKIRNAYAMANRGSLYVAQQELVEVLRMISQAKDVLQGANVRSTALAAGLRALREASDFAPRGTQLEAELDIEVLCASHRTPVAEQAKSGNFLPRIMMDRYLRYAQLQLSMSVAGDPAGSMALHALGKLHSQLGRAEPEKHRLADRRAIAYQQAALLAHNQNHLAAHELGVLLARSGHFAEAQQLLMQVAAREPNAVVYRNLARVQEELGQTGQALASREYASQLIQQGATGTSTVNWVPPTQFAQSSVRSPRMMQAQHIAQRQPANQLPIPGSRRPLTPTVRR